MARTVHLKQLYNAIFSKLDDEYNKAVNGFEEGNAAPALFIVLLYSAHEDFLRRVFENILRNYNKDTDAYEFLTGKLGNFSLKNDFGIFCSVFLPDQYSKSEVRKRFIGDRNAYAHRFFDRSGGITSYTSDQNLLDQQRMEEYFEYSRKHMLQIADAAENLLEILENQE